MKIETLSLSRLKNHQHFEYMSQFRQQVRGVGADALKIVELWEIFSPLYDKEDLILQRMRKSLLTDKLVELDNIRDEYFRSLQHQIESYERHFNSAKRDAAKKINEYFKIYKTPIDKEYNEETSLIYNILQDIKTKCQAEVTLLNLNEWLVEIDKANKEFNNTYIARSQ
jgi:hypothetical protein